MLNVGNVSKFYGERLAALSKITFSIKRGELVFLTGPSGAGKSTLIRLLYLEEKPSEGSIKLDNFDFDKIRKRQIPKLRRRLGIVFQDFRLIPERNAFDNVALALEVVGRPIKEIKKKTDDALKLAGVWPKRNNFPHQLSGGEAQRVALARAIVNEPLLLLADEPTGNLDEQNSRALFDLFKEINTRGATVIIATHQVAMANEFGHRRIHLVSGILQEAK
jgi:cell division transport system ATP-binding protein